ncbi:hypothetical protein PUN28_012895 [Cardiocondyla obscurior]|uniref:Secreted protein n=1 Tax=Cardiocondyla obscurior TaxID=286306 RepID=A0AAW2F952_9HYME
MWCFHIFSFAKVALCVRVYARNAGAGSCHLTPMEETWGCGGHSQLISRIFITFINRFPSPNWYSDRSSFNTSANIDVSLAGSYFILFYILHLHLSILVDPSRDSERQDSPDKNRSNVKHNTSCTSQS